MLLHLPTETARDCHTVTWATMPTSVDFSDRHLKSPQLFLHILLIMIFFFFFRSQPFSSSHRHHHLCLDSIRGVSYGKLCVISPIEYSGTMIGSNCQILFTFPIFIVHMSINTCSLLKSLSWLKVVHPPYTLGSAKQLILAHMGESTWW